MWFSDLLDVLPECGCLTPPVGQAIVPSSRLYTARRIGGSILSLHIQPGRASLLSAFMFGAALTIGTAGVTSSLTIVSRDLNGHLAAFPNYTVAAFELVGAAEGYPHVLYETWDRCESCPNRTMSYVPTISGFYIGSVQFALAGGLTATYWDNMHFSHLTEISALSTVDSSINLHCSDQEPAISAGPLSTNSYVSVRWEGFLLSNFTETHIIFLTLVWDYSHVLDRKCSWCYDRAILSVNRSVVINSDSNRSAVLSMRAGKMVQLSLELRHFEGNFSLTLEWMSASIPRAVIPRENLFMPHGDVRGSPFATVINAGLRCATASTT
eukprot:2605485-Rhodomonas_salina.1